MKKLRIPSQTGGYYEYAEKDGNLYRFLEVGFLAGVSFYLNDGLFLGLRGNFGLVDVTRAEYGSKLFRPLPTSNPPFEMTMTNKCLTNYPWDLVSSRLAVLFSAFKAFSTPRGNLTAKVVPMIGL